jgi:Flp pilus assembly protein CpaB
VKSEDLIVLVGVLAVVGVGGFFAVKALQAPTPAPAQSSLGSVLGQIGNTATAVQGLFN